MTMSDRIAVMNHGRYEQLADPASLYERPRTRFVAGFLGVSNLLPTKPDGTTDGAYAVCRLADGTAVRVPTALTEGLDDLRGRRPPREDPAARDDRGDPRRPEPAARHDPRRLVPGRLDELHRRDQGWRHGHGLRAERRARDPRRALDARRGGPHDLVARPHVRRRRHGPRRRPPAPWAPLAAGADDGGAPIPPPAGVSRRKFLIGGAVAVGAVGFAAFLASTSGSGVKPSPSPAASAAVPTSSARCVGHRPGERAAGVGGTVARAAADRHAPVRELAGLHRHQRGGQVVPDAPRSSRPRRGSRSTTSRRSTATRTSSRPPAGPLERRPADRAGTSWSSPTGWSPGWSPRLARDARHGRTRRTSWRTSCRSTGAARSTRTRTSRHRGSRA